MKLARWARTPVAGAVCSFALIALPAGGQAPPRLTATPTLRIGSETRGPLYQHPAPGPTLANDSSAYVVGRGEIRQYDMRGEYVRTIGRLGQGPGEFAGIPTRIGFLGDTLYVVESGKISLVGSDGTFLRALSTNYQAPTAQSKYTASLGILLRDGTALGSATAFQALVASGEITAIPIVRMNRSWVVTDTIAWEPVAAGPMRLTGSAGQQLSVPRPFRETVLHQWVQSPARIVMVDRPAQRAGATPTYRVTSISATGDTVYSRSYPYTPTPIGARVIDSAVRAIVAPRAAQGITDAQVRAALDAPASYSPITALYAGEDGSAWLRSRASETEWTVVSPTGTLVGVVNLPSQARLSFVRSATDVWGWEFDANDVPTLVRYRVGPAP